MKTRRVEMHRSLVPGCLCVVIVASSVAGALGACAPVDCLPMQQALVKIPEIVTDGAGHLRGTVVLNDQEERVNFRFRWAGKRTRRANTKFTCLLSSCEPIRLAARFQRAGVWLTRCRRRRARLGDIVELTFLNHINPADFGNSIDMDLVSAQRLRRGQRGLSRTVNKNGKQVPVDVFPNCFHGSSTGNMHFHGTHTNRTRPATMCWSRSVHRTRSRTFPTRSRGDLQKASPNSLPSAKPCLRPIRGPSGQEMVGFTREFREDQQDRLQK